jgi:PAS domain S-box-containing protein
MSFTLSRLSLRYVLLILFFLLVAIPAGAIGILLTSKAWERELQTVQEQHLQLARHLAGALARYAEDVEATFRMTAVNVANALLIHDLTDMLDRLHFKHVCIVNGTGQVERLISPTNFKPERIPEELLTTLRTLEARARHFPVFSNVMSDSSGTPTIFLWQPLQDGRFALGALKTEYFMQLQSAVHFGRRGHATIVDRSGHVLAHPNTQWWTSMQDIAHLDPVHRLMAGETGVSRFYSPALQEEMIAGFTSTPKTGWGVMVPQPMAELEAHIAQVQRAVWAVIGMALFGATVLGSFVARWLAAPLQCIGDVAKRFANGSYEARVGNLGAFHTREAAQLAAQFNTMADVVNRSWQAQQESEQRFREFAQIAADWFWETDLQQIFTYTSLPSTNGHNWDSSTLLGRHRCEHIVGDPQGQVVETIQRAMERQEPFDNIVYQVPGHDGQRIYLVVRGRPMYNAEGRMNGYRGTAHDITERLYVEAQLRQVQQEAHLRQTQKMEAIGTLAGGIAHDFNNILTAILGYTELTLRELADNTRAQQNLQHVLTAGKRARDLVQQILTFSRKSEPERKPVPLHAVIKDALKLLRASLPTTIAICQHLDEDVGTVLADPTQIHQVLMNLCANAEYAMRETGGLLEVCLDTVQLDAPLRSRPLTLPPGPYVRLTIRDTGHGMSADIMARIFEPFFTTKGVGQGTGMGLAVVHGIVTSHGGDITVQSTPNKGTTFTIYLPRLDVVATEDIPLEELVVSGEGTILFIDDEEALASLGAKLLHGMGYEVVVKTSSRDALEAFRYAAERFDLVITDQTMPYMTGEGLAREFRRIRPDIPIILCTGFSHTIDADKAAAQGIDAFLLKPLTTLDLSLAIQRVLKRQTEQTI